LELFFKHGVAFCRLVPPLGANKFKLGHMIKMYL
jgi:hypothetical protein